MRRLVLVPFVLIALLCTGTAFGQDEPLGACCHFCDCTLTTQADCTGNWLGPGTSCELNPCWEGQPYACCLPDGGCVLLVYCQCLSMGFEPMDMGTVCSPNPCLNSSVNESINREAAVISVSPNPSRGPVWIRYSLTDAAPAAVEIFSAAGCLLRRIFPSEAGPEGLRWDRRDEAGRLLPSGAYIVRLVSRSGVRSAHLILIG